MTKLLSFPGFLALLAFLLFACSTVKKPENNQAKEDSLMASDPLASLQEKIKTDPNNPDLYFQRAKFYFASRDLESAANDLNRSIALDSSETDFLLLQADIHFVKKEGIKAKEILNKIIAMDPRNTEALLKLAEIYFLVEQYDKSMDYVNQAIRIDVHNAKGYFMKGMIYKYHGDTVKAISSLQTATEQNNDYYDAFIQLGLLYSAKHDSTAVHYFDNALRISPRSTEALYGKSLFLQEHGQPEAAQHGYLQIVEIDSLNYSAYFNMGFVDFVYLNKYPEALANYSKALEINPKYFEAWCNRGIVYEKLKEFKRAEADFRKSLEIQPDYTPAAKGISRVVDKDFN